jgi:hypothetical protein
MTVLYSLRYSDQVVYKIGIRTSDINIAVTFICCGQCFEDQTDLAGSDVSALSEG